MKPSALLGMLEKRAVDNESLVLHFTHFGAMFLHLNLSAGRPEILHFSLVKVDPSMTEREKRNGFLDFLMLLKIKKYPRVEIVWADGMTFRQLEIPPMPPDDLMRAIEWDLKKQYYYNPEENLIGFSEVMEVEGAEGPEKLFSVFYCEKNAASARLSFVQNLGLEIQAMIPSQVALANFVSEAHPLPEHDVLICEMDGPLVRILITRDNRAMLVRQVTLGPQEISFTDEILMKITEEIKKTIDFYESKKNFRSVGKVVLTGMLEDEERVHAFLSRHMEAQVTRVDIESYLSGELDEEDKQFAKNNAGLFAAALGSVFFKEDTINLVPADIKTKNKEKRFQRWLNLALVGTAFLLFVVFLSMTAITRFVTSRMRILEKEYEEINRKKNIFESVLGMEKTRRAFFEGEVYSPALFKELSYRTPAIIMLNEMQYDRQEATLILRGEISDTSGENTKSVTQYAANLSESPFFTSVVVSNTYRDEEKKSLQFEVRCAVKGLL